MAIELVEEHETVGPEPTEDQKTEQQVETPVETPEEEQVEETPVVEDDVDISQLTDAQLEEYEKTGKLPEKETDTPPETPPETDTEKTETGEKAESAEKANDQLYAGKYKTSDELLKSAELLAKKLDVHNPAVEAVLSAAKETGEFKTVEKLYKQLEVEMGRQAAKQTQSQTATAPTQDTAQATLSDAEIGKAVGDLTYQQLLASPLANAMRARGLEIPKTSEEFNQLVDVHPYFAMQFQSQFKETYEKNLTEVSGHATALKNVEHSNKSVVDADTQSIRDFISKNGMELSDAEIEKVKSDAVASPFSYEDRYGVKFLRPGAVKEFFLSRIVPDHIDKIAANKLAEGRKQAIEDVEKNKRASVRSISTTGKTARERTTDKPLIDLNDPDVLARLTDEQLSNPEKFFRIKK